jgi:hypothetical protein
MLGMGVCHPPWVGAAAEDELEFGGGMDPPPNTAENCGTANIPLPGTNTIIIGMAPKLALAPDPGVNVEGEAPNGNVDDVNMKLSQQVEALGMAYLIRTMA